MRKDFVKFPRDYPSKAGQGLSIFIVTVHANACTLNYLRQMDSPYLR